MKKFLAVVSGMLLVGFLLATSMAGSTGSDQGNGQGVEQTNVSQTQIDTVKKREEARKQRDKKLKIRAQNVKSSPKSNDQLFQTSK